MTSYFVIFLLSIACSSVTRSALPPLFEGPHCRIIGCCPGRDDHCYISISGSEPFGAAICYCDDFCRRTEASDCCSDFPLLCVQRQIDMGALFEDLWQADENRISSSRYSYDVQQLKSDYRNHSDVATSSLFTSFDETHVFNKGTFKSFLPLCGNYEPMQGISENDTFENQQQVESYLDDVMDTRIMSITTRYLKDAGYVTSKADLREKIKSIWFTPYYRQAENDTSGFEHVFCGELKSSSSASGLHNWVTFYKEEKLGHLNYHGYISQEEPNQLSVQFTWHGATKPRTSIMLGVSTEFELAIFTAAFLTNPDEVTSFDYTVATGDVVQIDLQTWSFKSVDRGQIGSAYFLS